MGKHLKKALFYICFLAIAATPALTFAQDLIDNDLGAGSPGILPSNPFYFFKSWSRSIRQTFSFGDLSKAELQLNFLNEQAAEIKKLQEIRPDDFSGFVKAVAAFDESAITLKARLAALKGVAGADRVVDILLDRALKYQDTLEALTGKFKGQENSAAFYDSVESALRKIVSAEAFVIGNIEDIKKFRESFETAAGKQKGELREFRAVEFVDRLESAVGADIKTELLKLKDALLIKWGGRLQAIKNAAAGSASNQSVEEVLGLFDNMPGNILRRLKVLDEAREKISDPDLKNQINVLRQRTLDKAKKQNLISAEDAQDVLTAAEDRIDKAARAIGSATDKTLGNYAAQLLERARFNFGGAKKFYEEESFSSAYSQALAAAAAAENALSEIVLIDGDSAGELQSMQKYYDALFETAKRAGLSKESNKDLFAAFRDAASSIAKVSDALSKSTTVKPATISAIRKLKAALSSIGQMVEAAISSVDESQNSNAKTEAGVGELVADVYISGEQFVPAVLRVKKGATVTWTNDDEAAHWIASAPLGGLSAGSAFGAAAALETGDSYSFTFKAIGSWKYIDRLNPAPVGVVIVE